MANGRHRHLLSTAVAAVVATIGTTTHASRYETPLPFSKIQHLYHLPSTIELSNQNLLLSHNFVASSSVTPGNFFSSPGLTSASGNTPLSFDDGQFLLPASGVDLTHADVAQLLYGTNLNTARIDAAGASAVTLNRGVGGQNLSGASSLSVGTLNFIGAGTTYINATASVGTLNLIGSGTLTSGSGVTIFPGGLIITGNNSVVPEPATLALFGAIGTAIVTKRPKRRVS